LFATYTAEVWNTKSKWRNGQHIENATPFLEVARCSLPTTIKPIKPEELFVVHHVSLPLQKNMNAPIAKPSAFMGNRLHPLDGLRFRILAIVDDCTRERLALVADTSLSGFRVVRELDRLTSAAGRR
jgi:hypothetical protein